MTYTFDKTDLQILNLLQADARLSHAEIGKRVHKHANTIYDRVKRMENEGIIQNYVALLDNRKVKRGMVTFTHVKLKDHSKKSLSEFEDEIIKADEVMECYHMMGTWDFILKVATETVDKYHEFLMNTLFPIMSVGEVQSTIAMKMAKHETAYVLDLDTKSS